eukprot:CAMPEP_0184350076 /NCGR_PEP_ID=MMETSP1089-20130417/37460_1 /TAXON_ID=38269 ORGANISM="Gloeochaete wittrockiana, Strain SAG46.84" /NCGR_SAMPLE_ID=MMETSP1089 /ASSEMBLY_ACC=CAM_ASM_000445 /LENGTH=145 /DNA_ID=CAMNT_0026682639 /DNA_START=53 /DNA_END=487 /DNA_ORIENTATION=-
MHSGSEEGMEMGNERLSRSTKERYPYCLSWTTLPFISWFIPVIGHMGICTSEGLVTDFAGPFYVGIDQNPFGHPTRVCKLDPRRMSMKEGQTPAEAWDRCVYDAAKDYENHMYNLFCNNCHSYVAHALNIMRYNGHSNWTMFRVW